MRSKNAATVQCSRRKKKKKTADENPKKIMLSEPDSIHLCFALIKFGIFMLN